MTTVEMATVDDLDALVEIFNHYVATSNFDTKPATTDERRQWFAKFSSTGPHRLRVARHDGKVLGGYGVGGPSRMGSRSASVNRRPEWVEPNRRESVL
jgi:phosphinothricin acetyltransferase